jgi:glycosyltransferase involved in cell wall biosynthesis
MVGQNVIVVDLVFFQLNDTGIARMWTAILTEWSKSSFADQVTVLVRDNFDRTPRLNSIKHVQVPKLDYQADPDIDRQMLQRVCDDLQASLFISSYYTCPITTPSVFMAYDCIPESLGHDLATPMWQAKRAAIAHASKHIAISHSTAHDLQVHYGVPAEKVSVVYCGIDKSVFRKGAKSWPPEPYFMLAGAGLGYKNGQLLLDALSMTDLPHYVLCTGSGAERFVDKAAASHPKVRCMSARLTDLELAQAYRDATALVYPSKYEGFGLPIVEAMACGCPVVTCRNSSLPEAGGSAAWYLDSDDPTQLAEVLTRLTKNGDHVRNLTELGYLQANKFSWQRAAYELVSVLLKRLPKS